MKVSVRKYITVTEDGKTEFTTIFKNGNKEYELTTPHYTSKAEDISNFKKYLNGELFNKKEDDYHEAKKRVLDNLMKISDDACTCDCSCKNKEIELKKLESMERVCNSLITLLNLSKDLYDMASKDEDNKEEETDNEENMDKSEDAEAVNCVADTCDKICTKHSNLDYELGVIKDMIVSLKAEIDKDKE